MSLTERYNKLFEMGAVEVMIAKPPGQPGPSVFIVQVKQRVQTGPEGNMSDSQHQAVSSDLMAAMEDVCRQVEHMHEMKTVIMQIRKNRN